MQPYRIARVFLTDFLQLEQNSSTHVGHLTGTDSNDVIASVCDSIFPVSSTDGVGPTIQTVSQPARGHHVRFLSNSISAKSILDENGLSFEVYLMSIFTSIETKPFMTFQEFGWHQDTDFIADR